MVKTKYVFIDTNILLKVYSYSEDHPTRLKEILELIKNKKITLIIPKQIVDEFYRNRETKLQPSLKDIEQLKEVPFNIPSFCHDIKEIKEIKKQFNEIQKLSKKVHPKLLKDIEEKKLDVDKTFSEIFEASKLIEISKEILAEAKNRFDRGNPPGKGGSYGDAICWETLLKKVPKEEDLFFIGEDKDYISKIDKEKFSGFLQDEWIEKKNSKIIFFRSISKFLKEIFKKMDITEEQIKKEERISSTIIYKSLTDSKRVLPVTYEDHWTSGSAIFSDLNNEKEKKCLFCNKIYYVDGLTFINQCPYCGSHSYGIGSIT